MFQTGGKWLLAFLVVNVVLANLGIIYLSLKPKNSAPSPPEAPAVGTDLTLLKSSNLSLQQKVNILTDDINRLQASLSAQNIPNSPGLSDNSGRKTSYVTVPGSGSLLSYVWGNLPGTEFYFDPADFPGLSAVYFEANMKLLNGNGKAFLRLFDVTNGIEVWGSDVDTSSQNNTVAVSPKVQFRPGRNLIRVQAKSLTADTAVFSSGRLKIIQSD